MPAQTDRADVQNCRVTLDGNQKMTMKEKTLKLTTLARVDYTLTRTDDTVSVILNKLEVTAEQDGSELMHASMDKDRLYNKQQGTVQEVTRDKAGADQKQRMDDLFTKAFFTYTVDKEGKELKRTLSAAPTARPLVDNGTASLARLFHPPFPSSKDKWEAPAEVNIGGDAYVRGQLTYEKAGPAGDGLVKVRVSGTLTNREAQRGGLTMKDVVYKVQGEDVYDTRRAQWQSGKLVMDVSYAVYSGDQELGSSRGQISASLFTLPRKK
jgi:hypothetical protein